MSRAIGFALALLGLVAAGGCARDPATARLDEFAAAAAAVAGLPPPGPAERPLPYPAPRDRRLPEAEHRVSMLEFFALKRCGVREAIAERNSVLGRLQDAARRLAYEHALLADLRACLESLVSSGTRDDRELAVTVSDAIAQLERRLPEIRWNAGFGSDELAASFRPGGPGIAADAAAGRVQAEALAHLVAAVSDLGMPGAVIDRLSLVAAQEQIEKGRYGAALHRALANATDRLSSAADALEVIAADGCPAPGIAEVRRVYEAGGLGGWLDALANQGRDWFQALDRLRRASPPAPAGFAAWLAAEADFESPGGRWQRFLAARARFEQGMSLCREGGVVR